MVVLYDYVMNGHVINTQYGVITYLDWLMKEKERIEKNPERQAKIVGKAFSSCLMVNEVNGCQCEDCKKVFGE